MTNEKHRQIEALEIRLSQMNAIVPSEMSPKFERWVEDSDDLIFQIKSIYESDEDENDYVSCDNDEYFGPNDE